MFDPRARDGRTIDQTIRLARWLSLLCWAVGLLPLVLGCLYGVGELRPGALVGVAVTATLCLSLACTLPAAIYRAAAAALDQYHVWGAAVIVGVATLHAGAAGWVAYRTVRILAGSRDGRDLPAVLSVLLLAVASLVTAVAAVVYAYRAIGAARRLNTPDRPLGFVPVMPKPVMPAPPFGEVGDDAQAGRPAAAHGGPGRPGLESQ